MKRIESLLKNAGIKFEFKNLEIRFHKRQDSFLVVNTVKCKRGISGEGVCLQRRYTGFDSQLRHTLLQLLLLNAQHFRIAQR